MTGREVRENRRSFVSRLLVWAGWGGLITWAGGSFGPFLRFLKPAVRYESPTVFKLGRPADYNPGEVSGRFKDDYRLFVVRTERGIYVLMAQCTHLGCTTNWFAQERLIKCPCHGSNFSPQGDVLSGPAPQPLRRASISLGPDGRIVVDASRLENRADLRESDEFILRV